ncbi:SPRY-domain-containing protein [Gigaspora margarita]|uniref:SPRY-domain-containing protein n=1 Tax=Gigaspora margarita TaxID=4874 RepID=A0A8H3WW86_GIGMA|nr:SPRY-domain-containing protein [Gigaspora margarita]KAF0456982.1 SPRY-domain-containing protein [Gigaspora margarita]
MDSNYHFPSYLHDSPLDKCNKNTCSCITLPTHWNPDDCGSRIVIIDEKKLIVKHTGPGTDLIEAVSIRANHHIPPEVGLYYFEMTIINRGDRGFIGIGLSKPGTPLDRMPGWGTGTIGYHGDNGRLYYERERGVNFGPLYTTGETVGCGINFFDNEIFFTKNGILLGKMVLFKLEKKIYPTCGMASPNECVFVNFGTDPFIFPIDHYAKKIFSKAEKCK